MKNNVWMSGTIVTTTASATTNLSKVADYGIFQINLQPQPVDFRWVAGSSTTTWVNAFLDGIVDLPVGKYVSIVTGEVDEEYLYRDLDDDDLWWM